MVSSIAISLTPTNRGTNGTLGSEDGSNNVGVYAGAAAGAVTFVIVITVLVVVLHNRAKLDAEDNSVVCMSSVDKVGDQEVVEDVDKQPIYETIRDRDPDHSYDHVHRIAATINPHYDGSSTDTRNVDRAHGDNNNNELSLAGQDDQYICMDQKK